MYVIVTSEGILKYHNFW